eukprot:1996745-Pleurochrysis_carterae.AAC.1
MNAALDIAIVALLPSAAAVRDAGGASEDDWHEKALNDIFTLGNESDADVSMAMRLKAHGEDNPTWAQAMKGDNAHQWRDAARTEMQNFERHG